MTVYVRTKNEIAVPEFLREQGYEIEQLADNICRIEREGELPVFLNVTGGLLFFQVDLGNVDSLASEEFYYKLLDLNTEILPVSIGIDSTNPEDKRLVIVESREIENLDDNELMMILNGFEIAAAKTEILISEYLK